MRKFGAVCGAALLTVVLLASPSFARDSGWGCGGACRVVSSK